MTAHLEVAYRHSPLVVDFGFCSAQLDQNAIKYIAACALSISDVG